MNRRRLLVMMLLAAPASAAAQGETDAAGIRAVIEAQLKAFAADDAAGAYSFAAPNIKRIFPDPDRFLSMVREGYAAVHRQRRAVFAELRDDPSLGLTQVVRLTDMAGEEWVALYTMEKQPDGAWRITGCYLAKAPGLTT